MVCYTSKMSVYIYNKQAESNVSMFDKYIKICNFKGIKSYTSIEYVVLYYSLFCFQLGSKHLKKGKNIKSIMLYEHAY